MEEVVMEEKLSNLIKAYWSEDEETSKAYANLLMDHMSYKQAEYLIKNDTYFNKYIGVSSYSDVVKEIISDYSCLASKDDLIELLMLDRKSKNESEIEDILRKDGWIVGFGVAIGVC